MFQLWALSIGPTNMFIYHWYILWAFIQGRTWKKSKEIIASLQPSHVLTKGLRAGSDLRTCSPCRSSGPNPNIRTLHPSVSQPLRWLGRKWRKFQKRHNLTTGATILSPCFFGCAWSLMLISVNPEHISKLIWSPPVEGKNKNTSEKHCPAAIETDS